MIELIVDSFAGGGGASTGIEMALGRSPDIAINHDATALAMHEVNHPQTLHLTSDIWDVDPVEACGGRPVGLLWASPDCKHFSKAKGGKPVEKKIRGLAWVVVHWANVVAPRVIILENVEEFQTWGPLGKDNKPCPLQKGFTFKRWVSELELLGYAVEWRELRACHYGAPTLRKRLFLIARRDGEPITWPAATHRLIKAYRVGRADLEKVEPPAVDDLKPARVAAEIIDWSLPCPSIFDTAAQIMAKHGLRAVRPLQTATMARLAKGVRRYVVDAARPFIVNLTHHGAERTESIDEPMATVTGAHRGEKGLVQPFIVRTDNASSAPRAGVHGIEDPVRTITSAGGLAVATPFIAGVGGRMAQTEPRSVDQPAQTLTAKADSVLVATHLTKFRANSIGSGMHEPAPTVTANSFIKRAGGAAPLGTVAAHLMTMRNAQKPFQGADEPTHTVTAGGAGQTLVAAFLAQNNIDGRTGEGNAGRPVDEPVSTILQSGSHQGVAAVNLVRQFGTAVGSSVEEPAPTVMPANGGGGNKSQLSAAFLQKYYGTGDGQLPDAPLHTVTTKDRFGFAEAMLEIPPFLPEYAPRARMVADLLRAHGLWDDREFVTVEIDGITCIIVDIGMRMLTPRELFRAQGFPDSYIIDRKPDGSPISKTEQVSKCGNSVCPPMAAALVAANYAPRDVEPAPQFLEAAE
jgi:DNA (cytosine-5)-methyltransferase 1